MAAFYPDTLMAHAHAADNTKPTMLRHWVDEEWADDERQALSYRGAEANTWTNNESLTISDSLDSVAFEKTEEAEQRERDAIDKNKENNNNMDMMEEKSSLHASGKPARLRGIKSLVIGGLLLFVLGVAFATDISEFEEDEIPEDTFSDKLVDSWWAMEDYVDQKLPGVPIMYVLKMLLLAAGPVLAVSGLLEFIVSLRNRYTNENDNNNRSTLLMRGMILMAIPSAVLALAIVAMPDPDADNFLQAQEDFELLAQIVWGMHLVGVGMVIAGAIKARKHKKQQQRENVFENMNQDIINHKVDELLKSMPLSSSLPETEMNEIFNSEYKTTQEGGKQH
ncbi:hypothetical protein Emed_001613 [Eimeria media]